MTVREIYKSLQGVCSDYNKREQMSCNCRTYCQREIFQISFNDNLEIVQIPKWIECPVDEAERIVVDLNAFDNNVVKKIFLNADYNEQKILKMLEKFEQLVQNYLKEVILGGKENKLG